MKRWHWVDCGAIYPTGCRSSPSASSDDADGRDRIARSGEHLHFARRATGLHAARPRPQGHAAGGRRQVEGSGWLLGGVVQVRPRAGGRRLCAARFDLGRLFNRDTRKWLPGSKGEHIYLAIADGADIERALKCLQQRLWLAGYGFHVVGAGGQLLDRSIIDATVYGPERLVFEGAPVLVPPGGSVGQETPSAGAGRCGDR